MKRISSVIDACFEYGRSAWSIKFKLKIKFASLAICLIAVAASAETTSENHVPPFTQGVDEIVNGLRDVIDHGDLADERFYSKRIGVTLKGEGVGEIFRWGPMCGRIKTGRFGQYFNISDAPWYFDIHFKFVNRCGEYPYQQEFLPSGAVRVVAYIKFDVEKACVTMQNFEDSFIGLDYNHGPNNRENLFIFGGKNKITLILLSSGLNDCVGMVNLFQNEGNDS